MPTIGGRGGHDGAAVYASLAMPTIGGRGGHDGAAVYALPNARTSFTCAECPPGASFVIQTT